MGWMRVTSAFTQTAIWKIGTVFLVYLILTMVLMTGMARYHAAYADSHDLRLVTQSFPPLQYQEDGQQRGYVPEILAQAAALLPDDLKIQLKPVEFLPWKRAMEIAKYKPNIMFFSLSRTPAREELFHWLGEVSPYGQNFYQLNSRPNMAVASVSELKGRNLRIGVQSGSSLHRLLGETGITESNQVTTYTDYHQGVKMLYLGRLDMIPLTSFLARRSVCDMGYDGDQLQSVTEIKELAKPLWVVLSKGTDPTIVSALRDALRHLKQNGSQDAITDRHLEAWQNKPCGD